MNGGVKITEGISQNGRHSISWKLKFIEIFSKHAKLNFVQ